MYTQEQVRACTMHTSVFLYKNSIADALINCEVLLPHGEANQLAKVIRHSYVTQALEGR